MRRYKLYLDNWVFYPIYYKKDRRYKKVIEFLKEISKIKGVILCISDFNFTEFIKVTRDEKTISREEANRLIAKIIRTKKIKKYPIQLLECEGKQKCYRFADFFVDIQEVLINTKPTPSIADSIHATIMKNNNIKYVVTENSHFENIEKIKAFSPEAALKFFKKKK